MTETPWHNVITWHELMTRDPERAARFYRAVAGLETAPLQGAPVPYTLFLHDGKPVGGLVPPRPQVAGWPSGHDPHWVTSFGIASVDAAVREASRLGGTVVVSPTDIPRFGRAAVLRDPEGATFGIFTKSD